MIENPVQSISSLVVGMFIRATVWRAWRTVKKLPIVNWTMLLKLDHSATTDVPLGISKLLKLLQLEVLDVSMIDLLNVKRCWTPDNWVLKGLGQPCQNELAAGSFTLPVEYLQALRLDNVKWKPHKFMPLLPTALVILITTTNILIGLKI